MADYFVYIIKCIRRSKRNYGQIRYYTGMTSNLKRRFQEHQWGIGSEYMRRNKLVPTGYVYTERFDTCEESLKREKQIKKYSLNRKLDLIEEYSNMI